MKNRKVVSNGVQGHQDIKQSLQASTFKCITMDIYIHTLIYIDKEIWTLIEIMLA